MLPSEITQYIYIYIYIYVCVCVQVQETRQEWTLSRISGGERQVGVFLSSDNQYESLNKREILGSVHGRC